MPLDYAIDDLMRRARTITPESEHEAEEVYRHARTYTSPLPVGYVVKAKVRCNQPDTIRQIACDYETVIECRHEDVDKKARQLLVTHLVHAHPYLSPRQRATVLHAVHVNLRDFGR